MSRIRGPGFSSKLRQPSSTTQGSSASAIVRPSLAGPSCRLNQPTNASSVRQVHPEDSTDGKWKADQDVSQNLSRIADSLNNAVKSKPTAPVPKASQLARPSKHGSAPYSRANADVSAAPIHNVGRMRGTGNVHLAAPRTGLQQPGLPQPRNRTNQLRTNKNINGGDKTVKENNVTNGKQPNSSGLPSYRKISRPKIASTSEACPAPTRVAWGEGRLKVPQASTQVRDARPSSAMLPPTKRTNASKSSRLNRITSLSLQSLSSLKAPTANRKVTSLSGSRDKQLSGNVPADDDTFDPSRTYVNSPDNSKIDSLTSQRYESTARSSKLKSESDLPGSVSTTVSKCLDSTFSIDRDSPNLTQVLATSPVDPNASETVDNSSSELIDNETFPDFDLGSITPNDIKSISGFDVTHSDSGKDSEAKVSDTSKATTDAAPSDGSSPAKPDESTAKTDESTSKTGELTAKTDKPTSKPDECTAKTDASTTKTDASTAKTDELAALEAVTPLMARGDRPLLRRNTCLGLGPRDSSKPRARSNTTFRPPRQLTIFESDENGNVELDSWTYHQFVNEMRSMKTSLLKLKRELQETDCLSPLAKTFLSPMIKRPLRETMSSTPLSPIRPTSRPKSFSDVESWMTEVKKTTDVPSTQEELPDLLRTQGRPQVSTVAHSSADDAIDKVEVCASEQEDTIKQLTKENEDLKVANEELEHEMETKNYTIKLLQTQLEKADFCEGLELLQEENILLREEAQQLREELEELCLRDASPNSTSKSRDGYRSGQIQIARRDSS